jgi:pyruvate,water dikinase
MVRLELTDPTRPDSDGHRRSPRRGPRDGRRARDHRRGGKPRNRRGTVRIIDDPADADLLEPGEILVCRFTGPSWSVLFTLAEAVVIDIGGVASHGAVVSREMGLPCVIGTGDGSRRLRTGDLVRVDGSAGTVTVVARRTP